VLPSSVVNGSFFSVEFSNIPSDVFLLRGLHGRGAPAIVVEGSIDVNSVAGAIEVPFQLPSQEFVIRTDHSIPANRLACHFDVVASDPIDLTAISVRLRLKDPPHETQLCYLGWVTAPLRSFCGFMRFPLSKIFFKASGEVLCDLNILRAITLLPAQRFLALRDFLLLTLL
jgi:hypothetical protein